MRLLTLALLTILVFSNNSHAQSSFNLDPMQPMSIVNAINNLSKGQRDSLLMSLDTVNLKKMPISITGTGLSNKKIEKEFRGVMGELFSLIKEYLRHPEQATNLYADFFNVRYKVEAFTRKMDYEMQVKELRSEYFDEQEDMTRKERRQNKKDFKRDLAEEKRDLKEELKELKEDIEEEKKDYLEDLKETTARND